MGLQVRRGAKTGKPYEAVRMRADFAAPIFLYMLSGLCLFWIRPQPLLPPALWSLTHVAIPIVRRRRVGWCRFI